MKTNNKISAYVLRRCTAAILFSCAIVALCSAINLPNNHPKVLPPQDSAAFGANAHQNRSLSFADRVAYQRAIEDVFWRHRIWPRGGGERPDPKPSLDAVMSQARLEEKVTEYLRNSQALADDWQRPITGEQLQTEMERMASHTKQPEVLREIFAALGNNPFVIAECLARPVLAERLVTQLQAHDEKLATIAWLNKPLRSWLAKPETQVPLTIAAVSSANYTLPAIGSPAGSCTDDTWTPTTLTNAPVARYQHTAIWTGSEMIVWGGYAAPNYVNTGGRYNPITDSWTVTSTTNAPAARWKHTAVWTGTEMIVWGGTGNTGAVNTGGRYNPITDSWTATSTSNAPTARDAHTAVWTGSEMIVWGAGSRVNTGGRYDPSTDTWTATSTTNAPEARSDHTAVWTGSEMIVWGGVNNIPREVNTGGRYNPTTDSWTATTTTNAPSPRSFPYAQRIAVWADTTSEMIVWGGFPFAFDSGGRYNPATDSWTATSRTDAPEGRYENTAVWTGSEMIVWGGLGSTTILNTGGRYDPVTNSWRATTTSNAPSARRIFTAVWTGSEMIVWAGLDDSNTGGRYCAAVGVFVISSDPACGSVVFNQPIDFVINLNHPVRPATVQASDFTVNGTPANSFSLSNGNTAITFHYTISPVTTQGEQIMHIPPGALRDTDGNPVTEFDCTFRYDATLLAVTDTVPPVGGTFSPPAPRTYRYDVNWNEPVDPTSVEASDLALSGNTGATVTNVEVINGDTTTRFTLDVLYGGSLTADIAAGGITDQFGNPNAEFSGSYTVKGHPRPCVPPPPNMVSWWPGDDNTDDIVDGNNGTFVGNASFSTGEVGQAFSFDGSNYVNVPDAANLDFAGNAPISIDMWVYRIGGATVMHLIGKRDGCGSSNYQMALNTDSGEGLVFGGSNVEVTTGQDLPLNTWTHLAGTFDGSTLRFYINGTLTGTAAGTSVGSTNNASLRIGTSGDCTGFVGLVDEVELFNRALSQAEIQSIVDAGSAGKCKGITLSAVGRKVGGINTVRLTWSGATSTNIDVYRDGVLIATTANDGLYVDSTGDTGRARYTYKVCEAGTQTCSNEVTVRFRQ